MVVRTITEYMNDKLSDRVATLQKALNQAEKIIQTLDEENNRLKDLLMSLSSTESSDYIIDSEAFETQLC